MLEYPTGIGLACPISDKDQAMEIEAKEGRFNSGVASISQALAKVFCTHTKSNKTNSAQGRLRRHE
jgi:hypothetical protein